MANIQEVTSSKPGTLSIDWAKAEAEVGFTLHQDLKDFYSRLTETKSYGKVNFVESKFFEKTGNPKFDTWVSFNKCEGNTEYKLILLKSAENAADEIKYALNQSGSIRIQRFEKYI